MFVISYEGLLHGPFKTADEAARFAARAMNVGPWTMQRLQGVMTNEQMDAADAKRAAEITPARGV